MGCKDTEVHRQILFCEPMFPGSASKEKPSQSREMAVGEGVQSGRRGPALSEAGTPHLHTKRVPAARDVFQGTSLATTINLYLIHSVSAKITLFLLMSQTSRSWDAILACLLPTTLTPKIYPSSLRNYAGIHSLSSRKAAVPDNRIRAPTDKG